MADQHCGFLLLIFCGFAINAENPPSIHTLTHAPITFKDGDRVEFHCQAGGDLPISYQWFATDFYGNGKDISGIRYTLDSNTGQLVINSIQRSQDDGYYYCVAINPAGKVRSDRKKIQVSYLEVTPTSTASTSVPQGGAIVYTYPPVKSYPDPTSVTWKKGDTIVMSETRRISFSKAGNLYVANVDNGDVSSYKSTVANTFAAASVDRASVLVSVTERISIPSQVEIIFAPTNQVATSGITGSSVTFECFGSGRPMPTISWRRNGQTILASSKYSFDLYKKRLTIHNPVKADEGDYECHVDSTASPSPRTRTANLTVFVKPSFTVLPTAADKLAQESVTFSCVASGSPQPTITWFHNGAPPLLSQRVQINNNNELKFTSLQLADKGTVQCVATNDGGERIATTTLKVRPLPVWIDVPPKDTFAVVNETVEMECQGRGDPTPTITWKKDDVIINNATSSRYFFPKFTGSLTIMMSQKSDSAKYTCVVTNSFGSKWANATLTVLIKTVITNPLPNQIAAVKGLDKLLLCGVQSDPAITVRWYWTKDGSPVDESRMKLQNDGTLRIITVQESDAGTYECSVKSVAGNATTRGTLSVLETPLAPSTPVVSDIQTKSVRLTWFPPGYDGNSPITSYIVEAKKGSTGWQRQMDNINPSNQVSVLVRNLQPHTTYQFRVRAENQVGLGAPSAASGSIQTLIAAPSQAPQNVNGVPTSADSILVQWQIPPPESHNGPLRGFKIAYRLEGVAGINFTIKKIENPAAVEGNIDGLVQYTIYEIKVLAYNDAGNGKYSAPITVTTAEGVPTAPPQDVTVTNISTVSVALQWKAPPQKQQNGRIRGYKLQAWKDSTPNNIIQKVADHDDSVQIQRGTLTGLQKFTQYTVGIIAYNGAGDSPRSDTQIIKTEEGVPDAPRSFTMSEIYSDALRVSWDPPLRVNGRLIAYLVKHWKNGTSPSSGHTVRLSNATLSYTVTGLSANAIYTVQLSAETRAGIGTSKTLWARTTQSPVRPGAPYNLRVLQVKARSVVLNLSPGPSGRAPILSYTVQYNNDSFYDPMSSQWNILMVVQDAHLVWDLLPLTLPHLKPYTDYRFRVIAANKVGSSSPSNASDTVKTLEAVPSLPPSNLTLLQIGKDGLELRWKIPPRDTWNSDFIGFLMRFEPQGVNKTIHSLEIKVPNSQLDYYRAGGLLKYKHYKVSVQTYSLSGLGASKSRAVAWAWTGEDVPSRAPTGVTPVVTGVSSVSLSWGPVPFVAQNGEILGYKIYYSVVGKQHTEKEKEISHGLTFSTSMTGLESFVTYEFQILAYTRLGSGPRSSAVRATTWESTPGPPARVRFTNVGTILVTIAWDPPVYPRGIITEYKALCRLNSSSTFVAWRDDSIDFRVRKRTAGPLNSQTFYRFFVWARTKRGWSETPAEAVVFTGGSTDPPDAPFILPIYFSDIGERWIKLKWQATSDPKSPLRYFTVQLNRNGQGWQVYSSNTHHSARSLTVEGLVPGETYIFRIMATNDKGDSPYSAASSPITTRLALPTGAPRDIRIRSASPTSLLIEWTAPYPQELGGTLNGFIVKYREQIPGVSGFTEKSLPKSARQHTLSNLKVFTRYAIKVAAVNEKGPGPYTPLYDVTTGEKPPSESPKNVKSGAVTRTSIAISWVAPSTESFNGHLMGYKVYAEDLSLSGEGNRRRRRRRALLGFGKGTSLSLKWRLIHVHRRRRRSALPVCVREPGPKLLFVPPHQTNANITNLRKFVSYKIWVLAYNSIGESPPSSSLQVTTLPDRPGPPGVFRHDAVYNARVDLSWKPPCEPNGKIIEYEIKYGRTSDNSKKEVVVSADKEKHIITDLAMLTAYSFQIRARNDMGYGPPKTFVITTKGPAVLPGKPGKPVVHPGSITAVILWENGHSGNVPFEKFEIQSQTDASSSYQTNWEASPDETKRNQSYVSFTVGNLKPNTGYRFRIIAWNEVGASPPSDPSDKAFTGDPINVGETSQVYYKRWWFILLMVFFGVCLIVLIAGFIFVCYRRRKYAENVSSAGGSTNPSTLERRNGSRNGTIRSGTFPNVEITYRDTETAEDEVSSVGSKEELSDDSDSGVSEVTYKRKADFSLMNRNNKNPNHTQGRNSLGRPRSMQGARRNRDLIGHTTEESDVPDDAPINRGLKSFSVMSLPRDQRDGPPAYDGRRYMAKSADNLDRIHRSRLPPEAVTSFMSHDFEKKQNRRGYRYNEEPDLRPTARGSAGSVRRSRDQVYFNDDSSSPPQSPSRPNLNEFSYSPDTRRSRRQPRTGSFRRALELHGNPRDSDGSSKYSDRASSSSNDHRDTRILVDPRGKPRIQYDEEPGRRRRPKLSELPVPEKEPGYRVRSSSPSSRLRGPPSPSSPVSPAPSYHVADPMLAGKRSPVPSRGFSREAEPTDISYRRNQRVMYVDMNAYNNENYTSSEPHISSYSSFV